MSSLAASVLNAFNSFSKGVLYEFDTLKQKGACGTYSNLKIGGAYNQEPSKNASNCLFENSSSGAAIFLLLDTSAPSDAALACQSDAALACCAFCNT